MTAQKTTTVKSKTAPPRYWEGIGRRKTAVARVRIMKGKGKFLVNDSRTLEEYFSLERARQNARLPLVKLQMEGTFDVSVHVRGGGILAQAEAVRLGLARALVKFQEDLKPRLRAFGFLTRDPRAVERKKYGLKKARRAPQWSKR
ncbi:30S ribosomal protein S9 [Candidatus Parcubacteria bacterium]|nr:MAG: 30S ribosomal protein S9 [Candidatus Parcubacteria bacterium]